MYKVLMDVWVHDSKIASRILKEYDRPTNIDGWQIKEQYNTYADARRGADSIVRTAFVKYPEASFNSEIVKTEFRIENRQPILHIRHRLMLNPNWITGFKETLLAGANFKDLKNLAGVVLFYDNPTGVFEARRWTHYTFNEDNIVYAVRRHLNDGAPALRVELLSGVASIHSRCFALQDHHFLAIEDVYQGVPSVKFYTKTVYTETLEYSLTGVVDNLDKITGIRIGAVKLNTCYGEFNK